MKKDKKERSILPGVIIVSLLVAVIVYAVMLNAEKTALSDYEKGTVYVTTKPVPKGTMITADYITQKEVDKSLIPSGAVSNPENLTELISVYAVDQGSIITTGMFTAVNDITKDMTQPVVAGFKADDLYQVVGGVLRSGDRINIYQVNISIHAPTRGATPVSTPIPGIHCIFQSTLPRGERRITGACWKQST